MQVHNKDLSPGTILCGFNFPENGETVLPMPNMLRQFKSGLLTAVAKAEEHLKWRCGMVESGEAWSRGHMQGWEQKRASTSASCVLSPERHAGCRGVQRALCPPQQDLEWYG